MAKTILEIGRQHRQGDVMLLEVDDIPSSAKKVGPQKPGLFVLAEGETSGHLHAVKAQKAEMFMAGAAMYLALSEPQALRHGNPSQDWKGDHNDIYLPAKKYRVVIDREYQPDGWRQVQD